MRISLVTRHADSLFTPLALLYLKAAVVDWAGIPADDVTILEFPPSASVDEMAEAIEHSAPDVLGVSCYVWNVIDLMAAVANVKAVRPRVKVVAGGPEVGPMAERVLTRHSAVDLVVISEGESPFAELIAAWRDSTPIDQIAGVWSRGVDGPREHPPAAILKNLNDLSSPHDRGWVAINGRIACVETQRGCVFRCTFCFYNKDLSIRNRRFDLDRVKDELLFWLQQDLHQLYLMDPVFNLNAARAKEICRFIATHNTRRIPIHTEAWAEFIDGELAELMQAANFTFVEIGLQSTDAETLATVDRRLKLPAFLDGVGHLRRCDIPFELQLICGLPGDTYRTFCQSVDFAASQRPHHLAAFLLMVLPGTVLWKQAEELGLIYEPAPPYDVLSTPTMSRDDMARARPVARAVRRLWESRTIQTLTRERGVTMSALAERWVDWCTAEGADPANVAGHLDAFVLAICEHYDIDPRLYAALTRLELRDAPSSSTVASSVSASTAV